MTRRRFNAGMLCIAACLSWPALAQLPAARVIEFSDPELRQILRHGPWPLPWQPDPSNRVSGKREAIQLGERLFFEPRLSATGTVSCASCHIPEKHWSDGRKLGVGVDEGLRNTPTVINARLNRWFGWDGANDSLWAQSIRPILDMREMRSDEREVARLIRTDPDLSCRYRKAFGASPPGRDEALLADVGKALAAFQESIVSGRTAFDEFRDALARGDRTTAARYPETAQRGLQIFVGRGACNLCHFGPNFTNGEFHEIGVPFMTRLGEVDRGRYQGIKAMAANRFNLLRAHNDKPLDEAATSARHVALSMNAYGQFKVPSLRNVAATAPYMHNGSFATLADVLRHYSEIDPNRIHPAHLYDDALMPEGQPTEAVLKPLKLTAAEIADVVTFLETLTDPNPALTRRPAANVAPCR